MLPNHNIENNVPRPKAAGTQCDNPFSDYDEPFFLVRAQIDVNTGSFNPKPFEEAIVEATNRPHFLDPYKMRATKSYSCASVISQR